MNIGVDVNQVSGSHKKSNARNHKWMQDHGHMLTILPLPFGDYIHVTPDICDIVDRRGKKLSKMDLIMDIKAAVDRKNSIDEVCGNICSGQHERFREEAIRAQKAGADFYVLIENDEGIRDLEGVKKWSNPRLHRWNKIRYMHRLGKWQSIPLPRKHPTNNLTLYKAMWSMREKYGIQWVFTSPREAAETIVMLLER